jgi:hypothetical protein
MDDGVREGDDVAEGVPGGEGRDEDAVSDGVEIGDGWSSSEGGSELEEDSERGTIWNFLNRFGTVAGDCGLIGDWVISLLVVVVVVDSSWTGKRGKNVNLEAKAELGFEDAGDECGARKKGGCLGGNVPPMDEVLFDPPLEAVFDGWGGVDGSGNKGSKPTGTRFKS